MNPTESDVTDVLDRLHRAKSQAYGDAWRKRGEVLSIFCNIARKFDRLQNMSEEAAGSTTETELDTAADLAVYACKYVTWLAETEPESFDHSDLDMKLLSATRGDDAVTEALSKFGLRARPGAGESAARHTVDENFRAIEATLIAVSRGQPLDDAGHEYKVRSAIGLATSSLEYVFALAHSDSQWRTILEREIA